MKKSQLFSITALLLLMVLYSEAAWAGRQRVIGRAVTVSIADDYGRRFPLYYPLRTGYQGRDAEGVRIHRRYLEARNGERYKIRIQNKTGHRVGVVIAVDGRNIISGKKSYLKRQERMYILAPYQTASYGGWRTGRNVVNRFFFTEADNSYAHAWHDHTAMGVIAVAVYREIPPDKHFQYHQKPSEPKGALRERSQAPGTGFGEEEYSPSRRVPFHPRRRPVEHFFVKYEWRETLCDRRIIPCRPYVEDRNRFWDDRYDGDGYAPYPPYSPGLPYQRRLHSSPFPDAIRRHAHQHAHRRP